MLMELLQVLKLLLLSDMNKIVKVVGVMFCLLFVGILFVESQGKFNGRSFINSTSTKVTLAGGYIVSSGTNLIADATRPSEVWSNGLSSFTSEVYEDSNGAIRFANTDIGEIAQFDGGGIQTFQYALWTFGLSSAGNIVLKIDTTDTNKLIHGSGAYTHIQSFCVGGVEKLLIASNQLQMAGLDITTGGGPSILLTSNNTAANGSIYLDVSGILWKRTNSTWIVR